MERTIQQAGKRAIPSIGKGGKVIKGAIRHPKVVAEQSQAQKQCATVLYRSQRAAQLEESKAAAAAAQQSSSSGSAAGSMEGGMSNHPNPANVLLQQPNTYTRSAANIYREQRQNMKFKQHQQPSSSSSTTTSSSPHTAAASSEATTAGAQSTSTTATTTTTAPVLPPALTMVAALGGVLGAYTLFYPTDYYSATTGTVAFPGGVGDVTSTTTATALSATSNEQKKQPLWLQRPRHVAQG